jgi:hypothetical protein
LGGRTQACDNPPFRLSSDILPLVQEAETAAAIRMCLASPRGGCEVNSICRIFPAAELFRRFLHLLELGTQRLTIRREQGARRPDRRKPRIPEAPSLDDDPDAVWSNGA